jgi:hypothetical protein
MERGYISQTDFRFPLEWYPADRGTGFFTSNKRNVKLTATLKSGSVKVYRCEPCKKMIIDESTLDV